MSRRAAKVKRLWGIVAVLRPGGREQRGNCVFKEREFAERYGMQQVNSGGIVSYKIISEEIRDPEKEGRL
jgi:hypothetical protein